MVPNGEKLELFLLGSGMRRGRPLSTDHNRAKSSQQCNRAGQGNTRHTYEKETELYLFPNNIIFHMENSNESTKNSQFQTVVLEKTLTRPLDCKEIQPVHPKGRQSWIFIGKNDWWWSWSSSTLATWCEEPTRWKRPRCWDRLRSGGEGGDRRWDGWMNSMDMSLSKLWEVVKDGGARHAAVHGVTKSQTGLSNWTTNEIAQMPPREWGWIKQVCRAVD